MLNLLDWKIMKADTEAWKKKKPLLSIDFDGVIHNYQLWGKMWIIDQPPVPGAMHFIWDASEHFTIAISSARSRHPLGRWAMKRWLAEEFRSYWRADRTRADDILAEIKWPWFKPPAKFHIDDRAWQFNGEWPDLDMIKKFQPWNKRNAR
jgi:hypothetical protein